LRDYVTAKLERIRRHFDQVIDVSVFLSVDKLVQKAEISLHVRGKDLFAEASDTDLYAAIDALVDKLDRQVLKYKDKRAAHDHEAIKHQIEL
jgi:putative sigma-54 modulation protein